jgi:folate receptor
MRFSSSPVVAASLAISVRLLLLLGNNKGVFGWESSCTPFKNIYADGTELCEKMWDDSFKVVNDDDKDGSESEPGYTMWFFDTDQNPNDAVTASLFGVDKEVNECHLQYFHKDTPSAEDDSMSECHPWKNRACCDSSTVLSARTLKASYGAGYEWDRCGPMSDACQRFFVQEACLYECDPNAGLFRKYNDTSDPDYNEWQMFQMPIRKSYCDAWYDACRNDYFCGKGSFFECEAFYWEDLLQNQTTTDANNKSSSSQESANNQSLLILGLSIAAVVAVLGIVFSIVLITRERNGVPMFAPLEQQIDQGVST